MGMSMRKMIYCLLGGGIVLASSYLVYGNAAVLGAVLQPGKVSGTTVERSLKGDRMAAQGAGKAQAKVTTVEVIGLESAAVVFRDQSGRVLYQTDPVGNTTVVARGVTVPSVTIRSSLQAPVAPHAAPPKENPAPPAPGKRPAKSEKPVPEGCELAVSPLSESARAGAPFRCLAQHERAETRLAALH